eukprot:3463583-Amphidinium_carterae.1
MDPLSVVARNDPEIVRVLGASQSAVRHGLLGDRQRARRARRVQLSWWVALLLASILFFQTFLVAEDHNGTFFWWLWRRERRLPRFVVVYDIVAEQEEDARKKAHAVCVEQSVEVPEELVKDTWIGRQILGRIEEIHPSPRQDGDAW